VNDINALQDMNRNEEKKLEKKCRWDKEGKKIFLTKN
jgi:hypothetical protein